MTSSDHPEQVPSECDLLSEGWQRCFVADEPRLSEAVETYQELGYEVKLLPYAPDDASCSECLLQQPERFRVIFIRSTGQSNARS